MCVTEVLVRCDARTRVVVLVYWGCSSKVCGIVVGHGLWRWEGHGLLRGYGFFLGCGAWRCNIVVAWRLHSCQ